MTIDAELAAKQAYDRASRAFCDHVLGCSECTMVAGPYCRAGNSLLRAEHEAWTAYREENDEADEGSARDPDADGPSRRGHHG